MYKCTTLHDPTPSMSSIVTLAIPLKKAEHIDWQKGLSKFIANEYSKQEAAAHAASISEFHQLRVDVEKVIDCSQVAINLLLKYFDFSCTVMSRFPITETHIKLFFVWKDSFTGARMGQYYGPYEISNVLYNIGACYSAIAKQEASKTGGEGIKQAANGFQMAAGVFHLIREDLGPQLVQGSTIDVSNDFLDVLEKLMLAQAQECFVSKAMQDNKSDAIVAMLADQAGVFYGSVVGVLDANKTVASAFGKEWGAHVRVKQNIFHAIAQLRNAKIRLVKDEYGIQVAHLKLAEKRISQAKVLGKNVRDSVLLATISNLCDTIANELRQAERDNDTVYHEPVPSERDIPQISRKSMVRALPFTRKSAENGNEIAITSCLEYGSSLITTKSDPFQALAPLAVHTALSEYTAQRDALISSLERDSQEETALLDSALASLGLPASIEALETNIGLPSSLKQKVMDANAKCGGLQGLRAKLDSLGRAAQHSTSALESTVQVLANEQKEDTEMRERFGSRWRIHPSTELNVAMKSELERYQAHLRNARNSDELLGKRLQEKADAWRMLELSSDELDALFPARNVATSSSSSSIFSCASSLKTSLSQVTHLKQNRSQILLDFRTAIGADNIFGKLLKIKVDNEGDKRQLFERELGKFDPFKHRIGQSIAEQQKLLERITQENTQFENSQMNDETLKQRMDVLQKLEVAIVGSVGFLRNVDEGLKFYSEFDARIVAVKRKCDDFVVARKMQRSDVLSELTSSSGSSSASTSAHPEPQGFAPHPHLHPHPQAPSAPITTMQPTTAPYTVNPNPMNVNVVGVAQANSNPESIIIRCYNCSTTLQAPPNTNLVKCPMCESINQIQ